MATPRELVVAALEATGALPAGTTILPYYKAIDPPSSLTVMVRLDQVSPAGSATVWTYRMVLVLVAPQTTLGPGDAQLETFLIDVLYALVQAEGLSWVNATRTVYNESNPAFEVACDYTAQINKE